MKTHAIIEIEEGGLTLTIGTQVKGAEGIFSCERFAVSDTNRESITRALAALGNDPFHGAAGVHVIVGDRRAGHFVANVPKMPASEVGDFVTREALRVSNLQSASELMVAPRLLRQQPGGGVEVAASTLPTNVWQPLETAFSASGMEVLGLYTSETCLAMAAPADGHDVAILEYSAGRARFVLCDGTAPSQVRRFILGSSEGGSMALAAQLAIELPRTYDWLREAGHAEPKTLLLGNRLGLDDDSIEMLRGDLEVLDYAAFNSSLPNDCDPPGLATLMLMQRLFAGAAVPSLLKPPELRIPWSKARVLAVAATAVAGAALSVSGVIDSRAWLQGYDDYGRIVPECDQLEVRLAQAVALASPAVETAAIDSRLEFALSMRRPISRFIAEVSNSGTDEVHLEMLQFSSTEKGSLSGVVKGEDRQKALAALSQFVNRIRALPYIETGGQDEVTEVPGKTNCLRFRLDISWRNS